jgi:cell division protein FtsN
VPAAAGPNLPDPPPDPLALKPVLVVPPAVVVNPAGTQTASLPPPQPPTAGSALATAPSADDMIAHAAGFFIQTGAFANSADAEQLRDELANLGKSKVVTVPVGALNFSAVLMGRSARWRRPSASPPRSRASLQG